MSRPDDAEVKLLGEIAFHLREVFDESGHSVETALQVHKAFGSGNSRAWLTRDLAMEAIEVAASQTGVTFRAVNGSGRELVGLSHRYRLRKATQDAAESYVIDASNESSLSFDEEDALFSLESWVFAWTFELGLIKDVFIAEILDIEPGKPGRLILGATHRLGGVDPFGGGFTPSTDDDLPGFDDDERGNEDDDDGLGGSADDVPA